MRVVAASAWLPSESESVEEIQKKGISVEASREKKEEVLKRV
jgi:hypothetical protein